MRHLILPIALAGALLLGCGDQPTPAEPTSALQPSLRTDRNAEGGGALVIRGATQGIIITDPDRGFSLTIGVPPSEAPECGGTGEVTGARVLQVSTPAGVDHVVVQVQQQPMTLYGHFHENVCALPEDDIVALGRGNAKVIVQSRAGTTLFMIQATGKVELTSGGLAHLVVKGLFHIEPDGSLRVHVDRFKLTPIGG
jgi:hypothetical protein